MALFAASLRDLGEHVDAEHDGRFAAVADAAGGSAVALAPRLGGWDCFADVSPYDELDGPVPQARPDRRRRPRTAPAWPASHDLDRLTMFADNLVPHVLRLDGVLRFDPRARRRASTRERAASSTARPRRSRSAPAPCTRSS